ncbi:MAG: hypothetical protein HC858_08630 [Brachymonas sp.]|nr:hypothetical protein [Brachymonas sp.]
MATWQADQKGDPALLNVDLGHWPKRLQEQDLNLLAGIAGAIARLHSRAKPNEQHKHQSRPVVEDDAEFALASVGMLLREIGWARQ